MYNVFRYRAISKKHRDEVDRRIFRRQVIKTQYDESEVRYAVCTYQGHGFGYETPDGEKYESFLDVPYVTSESTARYRARKRWGYSKLMDSNNW